MRKYTKHELALLVKSYLNDGMTTVDIIDYSNHCAIQALKQLHLMRALQYALMAHDIARGNYVR